MRCRLVGKVQGRCGTKVLFNSVTLSACAWTVAMKYATSCESNECARVVNNDVYVRVRVAMNVLLAMNLMNVWA